MNPAVDRILSHPWILPLAFPATRGAVPIFTLHRFADPEGRWQGHDCKILRGHLEWLRGHHFTFLALNEMLHRLQRGESLYKCVAFTVDDGFADFGSLGHPVFAEFDCPVTVFLSTGFIDGRCWMWWNAVEYLIQVAPRDTLLLEHAGSTWEYQWRQPGEREIATASLTDRLKLMPDSVRAGLIAQMEGRLGVALPPKPTPEFAPLSWDDVRRCATKGVTFGPHTVTHPILAQVDHSQARVEITESWSRVRSEARGAAIPVFCYPNGDEASFGSREKQGVADAGLEGAVTTISGYSTTHLFDPHQPDSRFAIPRMPYVQDGALFLYIASGLERARRFLF